MMTEVAGRIYLIILYNFVLDFCGTEKCKKTEELIKQHIDQNQDACVDFYAFSCNNYMKNNPIKPSDNNRSHFTDVGHTVQRRAAEVLKKRTRDYGPGIRNAQDFFDSCMDEAEIDKHGLESLKNEIEQVGLPFRPPLAQPSTPLESYNFAKIVAKIHRCAIKNQFLFDIKLRKDPKIEGRNIIAIEDKASEVMTDHGLSGDMADMNSGFSGNAIPGAFMTPYQSTTRINYITKAALYVEKFVTGSENIPNEKFRLTLERARRVADFLKAVAHQGGMTKISQNLSDSTTTSKLTVSELQLLTNQQMGGSAIRFSWYDYIRTMLESIAEIDDIKLGQTEIYVGNLKAIMQTMALLSKTDPMTFLCAIWWTAANSAIPMATKELKEMRREYIKDAFSKSYLPRPEECAKETIAVFGEAVAHQFIHLDGGVENKDKVLEMTQYIIKAFENRVNNCRWLDAFTKRNIIEKLYAISGILLYVGGLDSSLYIDKLYGKFKVQKDKYYASASNILREKRREYLKGLFKSDNTSNEMGDALESLAFYNPNENEINVGLGFVTLPLYDFGIEAMNFGSLGAIIAHEVAHSEGLTTLLLDKNSIKKPLWSYPALQNYNKLADCYVRAYSQYSITINGREQYVNGQQTLEENLADNVGFQLALDAYRLWAKDHNPEKRLMNYPKYDAEKLYFLSFGMTWCENATVEFRAVELKLDNHAPSKIRVGGVLKNSADFPTVWGCGPDTPMNPRNKCYFF